MVNSEKSPMARDDHALQTWKNNIKFQIMTGKRRRDAFAQYKKIILIQMWSRL